MSFIFWGFLHVCADCGTELQIEDDGVQSEQTSLALTSTSESSEYQSCDAYSEDNDDYSDDKDSDSQATGPKLPGYLSWCDDLYDKGGNNDSHNTEPRNAPFLASISCSQSDESSVILACQSLSSFKDDADGTNEHDYNVDETEEYKSTSYSSMCDHQDVHNGLPNPALEAADDKLVTQRFKNNDCLGACHLDQDVDESEFTAQLKSLDAAGEKHAVDADIMDESLTLSGQESIRPGSSCRNDYSMPLSHSSPMGMSSLVVHEGYRSLDSGLTEDLGFSISSQNEGGTRITHNMEEDTISLDDSHNGQTTSSDSTMQLYKMLQISPAPSNESIWVTFQFSSSLAESQAHVFEGTLAADSNSFDLSVAQSSNDSEVGFITDADYQNEDFDACNALIDEEIEANNIEQDELTDKTGTDELHGDCSNSVENCATSALDAVGMTNNTSCWTSRLQLPKNNSLVEQAISEMTTFFEWTTVAEFTEVERQSVTTRGSNVLTQNHSFPATHFLVTIVRMTAQEVPQIRKAICPMMLLIQRRHVVPEHFIPARVSKRSGNMVNSA